MTAALSKVYSIDVPSEDLEIPQGIQRRKADGKVISSEK
jgi:hypothetical protein